MSLLWPIISLGTKHVGLGVHLIETDITAARDPSIQKRPLNLISKRGQTDDAELADEFVSDPAEMKEDSHGVDVLNQNQRDSSSSPWVRSRTIIKVRSIAQGMFHLHMEQIIHRGADVCNVSFLIDGREVKREQILLTNHLDAKVPILECQDSKTWWTTSTKVLEETSIITHVTKTSLFLQCSHLGDRHGRGLSFRDIYNIDYNQSLPLLPQIEALVKEQRFQDGVSALIELGAIYAAALTSVMIAKFLVNKKWNTLRNVLVAFSIVAILIAPAIVPLTGLFVPDFLRGAFGFIVALRLAHIFFIEDAAVVRSWNLALFFCSIVAFPMRLDKMKPADADRFRAKWSRTESIKKIVWCAFKFLGTQAVLFFLIPNQHQLETAPTVNHIINCFSLSLVVYTLLSATSEASFAACGLICGIPMKDMFNNPFAATSPRDMWSNRWNMVVKDIFHDAIFTLNQKKKLGQAKKEDDPKPEAPKKSSMLVNSLNALIVFVVSGLMHEYINYCTFDLLTGENLLFFIIHGMVCNAQVILQKSFPSLKNIPTVPSMFLNAPVFILTSPLFMAPYIRSGCWGQLQHHQDVTIRKEGWLAVDVVPRVVLTCISVTDVSDKRFVNVGVISALSNMWGGRSLLLLFLLLGCLAESKVWMGYYASWRDQGNCPIPPENIPADRYTHLIYSFASFNASGVPSEFTGSTATLVQRFVNVKNRNPKLKVLAAFGGGDFPTTTWSTVVNNTQSVHTFATQVTLWCRKYNFDGIDIDWETPDDVDRPHVVPFFKAIREAFHNESINYGTTELLLTSAAPAGSYHFADYQPQLLTQYVDYLNIMFYDFFGSWSTTTGPLAPLNDIPGRLSINQSTAAYRQLGTPFNKLVFGFANYGYTWDITGQSVTINTPTPNKTPGLKGTCSQDSSITATDVQNLLSSPNTNIVWDNLTQTSYMIQGSSYISYESQQAIQAKLNYALDNGFAGGMMWVIDANTTVADQCWNTFSTYVAPSTSSTTTESTTTESSTSRTGNVQTSDVTGAHSSTSQTIETKTGSEGSRVVLSIVFATFLCMMML
ncbi:acidic mammalian chitinase-like [Planoprotostelium fungivorum]|uniref:Acidic mammalian chitinase-like n=1 Tax=Planoprotostelium fungivorum TaxID=1890364 RepID=A0A2P6NAI2_9EUKA|nr:acidic mammalian chitinase-like [Planoprotostelium fungivorum]